MTSDTNLAESIFVELKKSLRLQRHYLSDERKRISRDIHDGIAQEFSALLMQIQRGLATDDLKLITNTLVAANAIASRGLSISRALLEELRTPAGTFTHGESESLTAVLGCSLADATLFTHLKYRIVARQEVFIERSVANELAKVASEAAMNALKHAQAEIVTCRITLLRDVGQLEVALSDNGVGFDCTAHKRGWGLKGMQERMHSLGGHFSVESEPGHGTTLRVKLGISSCSSPKPPSSLANFYPAFQPAHDPALASIS